MKKYLLLILLFNYCAYSQEVTHKINIELENCLNDEKNFTTLGMLSCYGEAELKWDKELNSVYSGGESNDSPPFLFGNWQLLDTFLR